MEVKVMQYAILRRFGVEVADYTCWRARKIMREEIFGSHDEGFKVLPQYMEEFKKWNSDSLCFINWIDQGPSNNPTFKRCLICVGSAIAAFKKNYRPLIGIDACHLKVSYKGILMTAMGMDDNNGQFPLAYGVTSLRMRKSRAFSLMALSQLLISKRTAPNIQLFQTDKRCMVLCLLLPGCQCLQSLCIQQSNVQDQGEGTCNFPLVEGQ